MTRPDPPTRPNPHATERGGGLPVWMFLILFGVVLAGLTLYGLLSAASS